MLANPSFIENVTNQTHEQYMKEKGFYFFDPIEELKNPSNSVHWQRIFTRTLNQQNVPELVV